MTSIIIIGRSFSLIRRHFFDIQTVIRRSVSYGCSLAMIAIFFFGTEFIIEKFICTNDEVVDIVCAVAGAFAFHFFRSFFDHATDKIFFRKEYDYAKAIYEIGPLLNTTIDLKFLLSGINEFLVRTVKPDKAIFIFDEASSPMLFENGGGHTNVYPYKKYQDLAGYFSLHFSQAIFVQDMWLGDNKKYGDEMVAMALCLDIAAIVPLALKEEPPAVMLLGRRLSGGAFRKKDVGLVTALAQQADMAVRNTRLYEETRHYNEVLEAKVAERTEKIRTMYESQSKFLTEVSHELQTPIAILRGNTEVLQGRSRQAREHALRVIITTVDDMSRLVGNLLESAKLKFSKNIFYKKDVCVGVLLQEIYEDCLILAEDKNIHLSVASEDIWVCADKNRLKEVILNLISNALKHTPRGGAISLVAKNKEGAALIIVQDTGLGIPPADLENIFERFYKMANNDRPRAGNNGIGLNICRQIVEAHGGTIRAESEVGQGSHFIIQLPILL
jgi:signal transduction histidine kinase